MIKQILEQPQTGFHPCGTCRLGKDIKSGVIDPKLQVYSVGSLRVINALNFLVIPDCRI
jgi:choline dehydrogenase